MTAKLLFSKSNRVRQLCW